MTERTDDDDAARDDAPEVETAVEDDALDTAEEEAVEDERDEDLDEDVEASDDDDEDVSGDDELEASDDDDDIDDDIDDDVEASDDDADEDEDLDDDDDEDDDDVAEADDDDVDDEPEDDEQDTVELDDEAEELAASAEETSEEANEDADEDDVEDDAEEASADASDDGEDADGEDDLVEYELEPSNTAVAAAAASGAAALAASDSPAAFWIERYDEEETGWERPGLNPAYDAWRRSESLKPPASVIIPGCGRSPELTAMAEARFKVIGVDFAPAAVEWQRAALRAADLKGEVVQGDILSWAPNSPVDVVYEQTCLAAIPPVDRPAYERQIHNWLKRGGKLFALFVQKDREGGPPYACPIADMQALFREERWEWSPPPYLPAPHPIGAVSELGVILTKK